MKNHETKCVVIFLTQLFFRSFKVKVKLKKYSFLILKNAVPMEKLKIVNSENPGIVLILINLIVFNCNELLSFNLIC